MFQAFFLFLLTLVAATAYAQDLLPGMEGRRTMTAVRMNPEESITLDGRLDEPVWQRAVPATDFIEQLPRNGAEPTEQTEVRIVFSQDTLYMGVTAHDSEPDKLLGNTMKRDEFLRGDDRFMWVMNPMLDNQSGYFFEMNPSGLMADSLMNATGPVNREWDGIWNAQVRQSEIGWTIEFEIPFRTLNLQSERSGLGHQLSNARCAGRTRRACGRGTASTKGCGGSRMQDCCSASPMSARAGGSTSSRTLAWRQSRRRAAGTTHSGTIST